jgi:hypothetical protein
MSGALTVPLRWCGVHHPHGPHRFIGSMGLYVDCPGSTGGCDGCTDPPRTAPPWLIDALAECNAALLAELRKMLRASPQDQP